MDSPGLVETAPPVFSTALVLCGGQGTRLRPLTQRTPKPLIQVANVPLIEHILEQLVSQGVERIILAVGGDTRHFLPHLPHWRRRLTREIYLVADGAGTGGAVGQAGEALPQLLASPFFVLNGDVLTALPLAALAAALRARPVLAVLAAVRVPDVAAFGALDLGSDGTVLAFKEKGGSGPGKASAGVYALAPEALSLFTTSCSIERDVFPTLVADGKLAAVTLEKDTPWFDLGNPHSFSVTTRWILEGGYRHSCISRRVERALKTLPVSTESVVFKAPVVVSKAASIGDGCVIGPNVVVGDGCIVGEGSLLKDSILLERSIVGPHCVINRSIISPDTSIKGETLMEDDVV